MQTCLGQPDAEKDSPEAGIGKRKKYRTGGRRFRIAHHHKRSDGCIKSWHRGGDGLDVLQVENRNVRLWGRQMAMARSIGVQRFAFVPWARCRLVVAMRAARRGWFDPIGTAALASGEGIEALAAGASNRLGQAYRLQQQHDRCCEDRRFAKNPKHAVVPQGKSLVSKRLILP